MSDESHQTVERIERHAQELLLNAPSAGRAVRTFFQTSATIFRAFGQTDALRRLDGISQLGLKRGTRGVPDVMTPWCAGQVHRTTELSAFSRLKHSEQVCGTMVAFCSFHRLSYNDTLHAAVAALLHDIGHPPFSHTVEPLLRRHGFEDHEAAGRRILTEDPGMRAVFAGARLDRERVLAIIREEGDLGLRQKLVDTCAYLMHDSVIAGYRISSAYAWDLFRAIGSVQDGAFEVQDAFLMGQFADQRAWMHAEFYEHPYNRLNSLLLREVADWLVHTDRISIQTIASGKDEQVLAVIRAADQGVPAWVSSARKFLLGDAEESGRWRVEAFGGEEAVVDAHRAMTEKRPSFLLPPIDLTGKSFPVRLPDGFVESIRADPRLRPEHHRNWHVVSYTGSV